MVELIFDIRPNRIGYSINDSRLYQNYKPLDGVTLGNIFMTLYKSVIK